MFLNNALDFLFPPKCYMCNKKYGDYLCEDCMKRLKKYETFSEIKFKNKNLNSLIYFFKYEKIIRELILKFKFFNKPNISKLFSKIMLKNQNLCRKIKFCDIIISVPMHTNKKLDRGYNQTELISKQIAEKLGIYYNEKLLIKNKITKRQSSLNYEQRKQNIKDAFLVTNNEKIKNKNIILVDDVYTSGATLEECAKVLKEAGAKSVFRLSYCKRLERES